MKMIFKKNKNKMTVQANDWLMKIKSDTMTLRDEQKFLNWLKKDPLHQGEFDLMNAIWDGADILKDEPKVIMERNRWLVNEHLDEKEKQGNIFSVFLPTFKYAAVAASLLLVVMVTWMMKDHTPLENNYQTATGEQRTIYLADGSTIFMDAETVISNLYSEQTRNIELKKGRALFSVTHDPDRPFVVLAGEFKVQAIGTQFNVYKKKKGEISVAVTDGTVSVAKDKAKTGKEQRIQEILVAGQSIVVDENASEFEVIEVDIKQINDWQNGRLRFNQEPLDVVIDEINRYLDQKIVINDPVLKKFHISINFDVNHRNTFLNALKNTIPIKSKTNISGQIVIYYDRGKV